MYSSEVSFHPETVRLFVTDDSLYAAIEWMGLAEDRRPNAAAIGLMECGVPGIAKRETFYAGSREG